MAALSTHVTAATLDEAQRAAIAYAEKEFREKTVIGVNRNIYTLISTGNIRTAAGLLVQAQRNRIPIDIRIVRDGYNLACDQKEFAEQSALEAAYPFLRDALTTLESEEVIKTREMFRSIIGGKFGTRGLVNEFIAKKAAIEAAIADVEAAKKAISEAIPDFLLEELEIVILKVNEGTDLETLYEAFPNLKNRNQAPALAPAQAFMLAGPAVPTGYPLGAAAGAAAAPAAQPMTGLPEDPNDLRQRRP